MEDRRYCMSSYLMFRTIADANKSFYSDKLPCLWQDYDYREAIHDSFELEEFLKNRIKSISKTHKLALALSGGIDSAILAKFMLEGSIAYTFKCVVPDTSVIDETPIAKKYAEECGLEHKVIEIYWEDFEKYAPVLMAHKNSPVHSIEVQIYKASLAAQNDGATALVFGENADAIYGGMSSLLSKEWGIGEFIERYSYLLPYKALKNPKLILEPYYNFCKDGYVDPHFFVSEFFRKESMGSYINATETAGIVAVCPFSETYLAEPIDYNRIRNGENKYLVREVFQRLYKDFEVPPKTPMPRPMNEWLKDWKGPTREEFWPHCTDTMSGDQKWLVWCLERFLNFLDFNK